MAAIRASPLAGGQVVARCFDHFDHFNYGHRRLKGHEYGSILAVFHGMTFRTLGAEPGVFDRVVLGGGFGGRVRPSKPEKCAFAETAKGGRAL